jgi:hypothetical protein
MMFSPGDTTILLSLVNERIKKHERQRLKAEAEGVPFNTKARFNAKRLQSIKQVLQKHLSDEMLKRKGKPPSDYQI